MNITKLFLIIFSLIFMTFNMANALDSKPSITLDIAKKMADACEAKHAQTDWRPLNIAIIDDGAAKAILTNKSLLPAGIIEIKGKFERGDIITVDNKKNKKIAVGVVAYNSNDAKKIIGKKSKDIMQILGYETRDELIHKDDLVIIKNEFK